MKKIIYALTCLTIAFWFVSGDVIKAQGSAYWTESFNDDISDQLPGSSSDAPQTLTEYTQGSGTWTALKAYRGGSNQCDATGKTLRLLKVSDDQGGVAITPAVTQGIATVTFVEGRGGTNRNIVVSKSSDNGTTWVTVSTLDSTIKCEQIVINVNDAAATNIKLENVGTGDCDVDDITLTKMSSPGESAISMWGLSAEYNTAWPILNDSATAAGDASMGGDVVSAWKGLQGGFSEMTISTTQAVVVKGQIAFVGADAGAAYTPIRYAITYQDSNTTLVNALTDSATWSHQGNHFGYGFHPRTGAGTMSNGNGGQGTVWTINNGNWASTWSNNGGPIASVLQAPRNAEIIEGTYDFAISVQSVDDTTNEIRWYMVEENNKYWFGGTVQATATTKKFNSIILGVNEVEWTEFDVTGMTAELGDPITVPEAPWESFYVDQWGTTPQGSYWPVLNDSSTLVGDGIIGGDEPLNGAGWATIQGGFGQAFPLKTDEALIVTGELEFVGTDGGGSSYTPIRYALAYQDGATLNNALTDSASWTGSGGYSGYGFHPRTGAGTMSNGNGGVGTVWTLNNGNWNSTWSNNGGPIASVLQAPRNAQIVPGTYEFAFSVMKVDDETTELRWYMIEKNNKYWYGGTLMAPATTDKINAICFGINTGDWTEFRVVAAEVDYGTPIEVPEAPWESYYIDQWGLSAEYNTLWPILNDSTTLVGDASMGGDVVSGWKGLQGGFGQAVTTTTDKAVIVSGQIEFVGADAGDAYTPIRYALTFQDSNTTLVNALTDSATWSHQGNHFGYGFHPRTGAGTMSNGNGGQGTVWTINNGNWASTWSNNGGPVAAAQQAPRNAEIIAGTYDFAISVQAIDETTNEIRWYMSEVNEKYWFGGTVRAPATTQKFNSIIFGVNEVEFSAFNVIAMEVDRGDPIDVPIPPFSTFYVGDWGFSGGQNGNWTLTPGELTGNVSVSGSGANGWTSLRGGFDFPVSVPQDEALIVEGKMELIGGGFEGWNSLQMGLVNYEEKGTLVDTTWVGTGLSNGYLFLPISGNNEMPPWANNTESGTVGAVVNTAWNVAGASNNYVIGDKLQYPAGAVAGPGAYDFAFSFIKKGNNTEIRYYIHNDNYAFGGILVDNNQPIITDKFNSFNIGLYAAGGFNKTLNLIDVQLIHGDPIDIPSEIVEVEETEGLPTQYALNQNYPNPFNPTTTIEFALPQNSNVKLVVYDILGRAVANLVDGNLTAGYHKVNFNATNLASGVYFYSIKAGDFVSVKKLMLLK